MVLSGGPSATFFIDLDLVNLNLFSASKSLTGLDSGSGGLDDNELNNLVVGFVTSFLTGSISS